MVSTTFTEKCLHKHEMGKKEVKHSRNDFTFSNVYRPCPRKETINLLPWMVHKFELCSFELMKRYDHCSEANEHSMEGVRESQRQRDLFIFLRYYHCRGRHHLHKWLGWGFQFKWHLIHLCIHFPNAISFFVFETSITPFDNGICSSSVFFPLPVVSVVVTKACLSNSMQSCR